MLSHLVEESQMVTRQGTVRQVYNINISTHVCMHSYLHVYVCMCAYIHPFIWQECMHVNMRLATRVNKDTIDMTKDGVSLEAL